MLKYSIVTINYKTATKVKKLWQSLHEHLNPNQFEFILLDNASGEAEKKDLEAFFAAKTQSHFIPMKKNLGFGGGYAEAVRFARGEYLVLINPDIELLNDCLEQLVGALETHDQAGLVAPQLQNPDGTTQINARPFPTLLGLLKRRMGQSGKLLASGPVPWVQGSFMLMRRRFFLDVLHGFDSRFFLFFEDTDLCRRTWESGFTVRLVGTAKAVHGEKRLSGNDIFTAMFRKTFWIHVNSAVKYFWKYRGTKVPVVSSR